MKDYCVNCSNASPQDNDNGEYIIMRNDVLNVEKEAWICNNCKAGKIGASDYNDS